MAELARILMVAVFCGLLLCGVVEVIRSGRKKPTVNLEGLVVEDRDGKKVLSKTGTVRERSYHRGW